MVKDSRSTHHLHINIYLCSGLNNYVIIQVYVFTNRGLDKMCIHRHTETPTDTHRHPDTQTHTHVLSLPYISMENTTWRGKGLIQFITGTHLGGKSGEGSKTKTEAEPLRILLTSLFSMACSADFLFNPCPPAQGSITHCGLGPLTSVHQ